MKEGSGTTVGAREVSPMTVGDTIYDDGPGGVAPLTFDEYSNRTNTESSLLYTSFNKYQSPSSQKARDYKCPSCGGEFNSWLKKYKQRNNVWLAKEDYPGSTMEKPTRNFCPFCNMERGEYEGDNNEN